MIKPLIGIVGKEDDLKFYGWSGVRISNDMRYALVMNGARVIGIMPPNNTLHASVSLDNSELYPDEKNDFESILALCDGILLQGGVRAHPFEIYAVQYALKHNKPLLGICMGMNTMVRALGGRVTKIETENHYCPEKRYAHRLSILPNTMFRQFMNCDEIVVNSIHHYKIQYLKEYHIAGMTRDHIIEAIEMPGQSFHLGVHFHPELLIQTDPMMNMIFRKFVEAASGQQR